jgi:hypothetical protein
MKTRSVGAALITGSLAALLLAACGKQERVREIDWAKAALARNPAFEIVATDESSGVFTVRDTSSGVVRTLRLEDLIATQLPPKVSAQPASPATPLAPMEAEPTPAEAQRQKPRYRDPLIGNVLVRPLAFL